MLLLNLSCFKLLQHIHLEIVDRNFTKFNSTVSAFLAETRHYILLINYVLLLISCIFETESGTFKNYLGKTNFQSCFKL